MPTVRLSPSIRERLLIESDALPTHIKPRGGGLTSMREEGPRCVYGVLDKCEIWPFNAYVCPLGREGERHPVFPCKQGSAQGNSDRVKSGPVPRCLTPNLA